MSLYKIGSSYFVLDGHHRVSVARFQGVEFTDAEVTEFRALLPGDRKDEGRPIHHPSSGAGESPSSGGVRPSPSRRSGRPRAAQSAGAPRGASTASTSAPLPTCPGTARR